MTIEVKNLIDRYNQYKAKTWLSRGFWSKLTSAYENLNHVVAAEIIRGIKEGQNNLKFDDKIYAQNFANLLVNTKVSISALIVFMRKNDLSFSGIHFYAFLETLCKQYVQEPGLFTETVRVRMESIKALPFTYNNELNREEKQYIQSLQTPLELVNMMLQKPDSMSFTNYHTFILIQSAFDDITESRSTEIILIGLKNLMLYEAQYTDKTVVEKDPEQQDFNIAAPQEAITVRKKGEVIAKIEEWAGDTTSNKKVFATKLFAALDAANLIGTGYEKQVVDYLVNVDLNKQDKAIKYAVAQARAKVKTEIQTSADALRRSLLGLTAAAELPKFELESIRKDEKDISITKFLERLNSSGRLQRAANKYVMQKLREKDKLKDAAMIVSGHENTQKIAAMFASMNPEIFTLIGAAMIGVISEIQSEHNLNPELWGGTISRGWSKITSYPVAAFFAVVDFFALVFEYIGEYVTRGAYKAYEGAREMIGKPVAKKREEELIFRQNDIEAAMSKLVNALKDVNTEAVKLTQKEELKDAILIFLKDGNNSDDLTNKLAAVHKKLDNSKFKTAIGQVKNQLDLQAILEMPKMNQSVSDGLHTFAKMAQVRGTLYLIK